VTLEGLGRGCGGNVHRAIHATSLRFVAIKEVTVHDEARLQQIVNEIKTLKWNLTTMENPVPACENVVSFYDAYMNKNKGKVSVVLEMCSNGSLQDVINNVGKIPEVELASVTRDILKGMSFIHGKGLLHRDIKPGNILLTLGKNRPVAKVADFGLVKDFDKTLPMGQLQREASKKLAIDEDDKGAGSSDTRAFIGTPIYMSPERLQGQPYSYPSDVWSIGLSLLTCALGKYPVDVPNEDKYWFLLQLFSSEATVQKAGLKGILDYNEDDRPSSPDGSLSKEVLNELMTDKNQLKELSPGFVDFLTRCLQKNPQLRQSCDELLEHAWVRQAVEPRPEVAAKIYDFFESSSMDDRDLEESAQELEKICRRLAVWHKAHMHRQMDFLKRKHTKGMLDRKTTFWEKIGMKSGTPKRDTSRFLSPKNLLHYDSSAEGENSSKKITDVFRRSFNKKSGRKNSTNPSSPASQNSSRDASPGKSDSNKSESGLSSTGLSKAFRRKSKTKRAIQPQGSESSLGLGSLVDEQLDNSQVSLGSQKMRIMKHQNSSSSSFSSNFGNDLIPPCIDTSSGQFEKKLSRYSSMGSQASRESGKSSGRLSIRSRGSPKRTSPMQRKRVQSEGQGKEEESVARMPTRRTHSMTSPRSPTGTVENPPWGQVTSPRKLSAGSHGSSSSPRRGLRGMFGSPQNSMRGWFSPSSSSQSPTSPGSVNCFTSVSPTARSQDEPPSFNGRQMWRKRVISGGTNFAPPLSCRSGRRTQSIPDAAEMEQRHATANSSGHLSPSVNPRLAVKDKKEEQGPATQTSPPQRRPNEKPMLKGLSIQSPDSDNNQSTNSIRMKNEDWDDYVDRDTDQSGNGTSPVRLVSSKSDDVPCWDDHSPEKGNSSLSVKTTTLWEGIIDGKPPRSPNKSSEMRGARSADSSGPNSPGSAGIVFRKSYRSNRESRNEYAYQRQSSAFDSEVPPPINSSSQSKSPKKLLSKAVKKIKKRIRRLSSASPTSDKKETEEGQCRIDASNHSNKSHSSYKNLRTSSGISELTDADYSDSFRESDCSPVDDLPDVSLHLTQSISQQPTRYDHPSPLEQGDEDFCRRRRSYSGPDHLEFDSVVSRSQQAQGGTGGSSTQSPKPGRRRSVVGRHHHSGMNPHSTKAARRPSLMVSELYAPAMQELEVEEQTEQQSLTTNNLTKHFSTLQMKQLSDSGTLPQIQIPIPIKDSAFRELAHQLRISDQMVKQVFKKEWKELNSADTPRTRTPF